MYIVLTGDLKSSKKMLDRNLSQEKLKEAINYVNSRFKNYLVTDFMITGGDSFQGMISRLDILVDLYFALYSRIGNPFYLGVGMGSISTSLSEFVQEIDGEAFHLSADALRTAKKKKRWIVMENGVEGDVDVAECILNLLFEIVWSWTDRQANIILYYREKGENPQTIKQAAVKFETGSRNIYKTLETGKYSLVKYSEGVARKQLKKIQHTIIDPK